MTDLDITTLKCSPHLNNSVSGGNQFTKQAQGNSPASLKRAEVRKNFCNRNFFSESVITNAEQRRRKSIADGTKQMILSQLHIEEQDESSLMTNYRDYYLQISFSELHPLMVFCLAKALTKPSTNKQRQTTNELNLTSILGSHSINDEVGCYSYRATHWLDKDLDASRFFEILNRCVDEADKGYRKLAS